MPTPPVIAPASFVPRSAISFGEDGAAAVAVSSSAPLPVTLQGAGGAGMDVRSAAPAAAATALIANGGSLSAGVDLAGERLHRIVLPAAWTAAAISFQSSGDGTAWTDLYDTSGEVVLAAAVVGASRAVVVDPAVFLGIRYLKLRSGIAGGAVAQAADRTVTLVTVAR